jgi:hypothetical protein
MSDARRKLPLLLQVGVWLVLVVGFLAVVWLTLRMPLQVLLFRFISESEPTAGPPPEAFERFRGEQEDIVGAVDRGPIRCSLSLWPKDTGDHPPDLAVCFTNTSVEPVTHWYYTWPHAHVTFLVRDEGGKIVEQFHWGSLSSVAVRIDDAGRPTTKLPTRTLAPGEAYTAGIYLGTLRDYLEVPPGRYGVEAVFTYDDLGSWPDGEQHFVARSETVEVEAGEPGADGKKQSWCLR